MSELTIEQKAKLYDKAIKKAEKWRNAPNVDKIPTFGNRIIEDIFPEIYKSKDEQIKEELIDYLKERKSGESYGQYVLQCDHWITWLEKQEQSKKTSIWKHWKNGICGNGEGKAIFLIKRGSSYSLSSCLSFECDYIELSELENLMLEKQDKQNIKPKFKAGDWIIFNGLTLYINEVTKGYYRTISKGGIPNSYDWNIDNAARLWTIEDAKEGDVLSYITDEEDLWIMIYRSLYKPYENHVHYHALLINDDFTDRGTCLIDINYLKPASEEQRKLLFTRMKESSYMWDVDKKELKKIEQKPVEETSCDKCKNVQPSHSCQDIAELGRCYLEHEKQGEQKPTWSEDDEKKRTLLIKILETNHPHGLFKVNSSETMCVEKLVSWLKSLIKFK